MTSHSQMPGPEEQDRVDRLKREYERMRRDLPPAIGMIEKGGFFRARYAPDAFEELRAPQSMLSRVDQVLSDPASFTLEWLTGFVDYLNREAAVTITPQVRIKESYFEQDDERPGFRGLYRIGIAKNLVDERVVDSAWLVREATRLPVGTAIDVAFLNTLPTAVDFEPHVNRACVLMQPGDAIAVERKLLDDFVVDFSDPNNFCSSFKSHGMHFADGIRLGGIKNLYKLDYAIHPKIDWKVWTALTNYPAVREMKLWHSFLATPYLPEKLKGERALDLKRRDPEAHAKIVLRTLSRDEGRRISIENKGPDGVVLQFRCPPKDRKPAISRE